MKLDSINLDAIEIEEFDETKKYGNIPFNISSFIIIAFISSILFTAFLFYVLDSVDTYLYITCIGLLLTIFFGFLYHWAEKKKLRYITVIFLVFVGFSSLFCLILYLFFL